LEEDAYESNDGQVILPTSFPHCKITVSSTMSNSRVLKADCIFLLEILHIACLSVFSVMKLRKELQLRNMLRASQLLTYTVYLRKELTTARRTIHSLLSSRDALKDDKKTADMTTQTRIKGVEKEEILRQIVAIKQEIKQEPDN
jgi:hypothetical protein